MMAASMCRYLDESIVISALVSSFLWRTPDDGQAQGGGVVWRRGGVDDGPCTQGVFLR